MIQEAYQETHQEVLQPMDINKGKKPQNQYLYKKKQTTQRKYYEYYSHQ